LWIVHAVRSGIAAKLHDLKVRERIVRRNHPRSLAAYYRNVFELYRQLHAIPASPANLRKAKGAKRETPVAKKLAEPAKSIVADIEWHFPAVPDGSGVTYGEVEPNDQKLPRWTHAAAKLSPREIGRIYRDVATRASRHFRKPITVPMVKRCIAAWIAFENSLGNEPHQLSSGLELEIERALESGPRQLGNLKNDAD
jgi:hypothetical protein